MHPVKLGVMALCLLAGCATMAGQHSRKKDPPRDPYRAEAKHDRWAVAIYLGAKDINSRHIAGGKCELAPDDQQRAFCEGRFDSLKDPDLVKLGHGTSDDACLKIKNPDLMNYCVASQPAEEYSRMFYCDKIGNAGIREVCVRLNSKRPQIPQDEGGGGQEPSGGGETASCLPSGAELPKWGSVTQCCSGDTRPESFICK